MWYGVVLVAAIGGTGDDLPANIGEYLDRCVAQKRDHLNWAWENKDGEELRKELTTLRDDLFLAFFPRGRLRIGDIGHIRSLKVSQVVDDLNVIGEVRWSADRRYKIEGPNGAEFTKWERLEELVWIGNMSTEGMIDDASYAVPKVFEVTGTKRYPTALGGTKTVHLIEPVDMTPYVEELKKRLATVPVNVPAKALALKLTPVAKPKAKGPKESEYRTWTDASGKFSIEAALVDFRQSKAVFLKRDGTKVSVPSSKLCEKDRRWIRAEMKLRKITAPVP